MKLDFTNEDVRQHLNGLGYKNISEDQLKDFVHDLRRLIRYEEKQENLQKLMANEQKSKDEIDEAKFSRIQRRDSEKNVRKVLKQERKTLHYNKSTGDISLTNDSVSFSYEESSSSHEEVVDEVRVRITTGPQAPFKDIKVGELKQILPPRPELPTKPTCSFIRPVIKEPKAKSLKHDPVRLHQFYQEQWKKQRLPGEMNRTEKDIRWATREWMSKK